MQAQTSSPPPVDEEHKASSDYSAPPPMTRAARRVAVLVTVVAVVGLGGSIGQRLLAEDQRAEVRDRTSTERREQAAAPPRVEVATPVPLRYEPHFSITGTLDPVQQAELGFNVMGRLVAVEVTLGQVVQAGQLLARIDSRSVTAQTQLASAAVQTSRTQVATAEDRLRRARTLHERGATSDAELEAAQQQLSLAQAQLAQATAQTRVTTADGSNHLLRAPFAGTVTRVPEGIGQVVGPQQSLFRIEDLTSLVLRSGITERALDRIQVGDTVELESSPVRGVVRAFARSLDPISRRAPVEITLTNPEGRLIGHSLVKGSILTDRPYEALVIPATAIRADQTVLVVDAEEAIGQRSVVSVIETDGRGVVLSGLEADDRVVVRPSPDMTAGLRVSPHQRQPAQAAQ